MSWRVAENEMWKCNLGWINWWKLYKLFLNFATWIFVTRLPVPKIKMKRPYLYSKIPRGIEPNTRPRQGHNWETLESKDAMYHRLKWYSRIWFGSNIHNSIFIIFLSHIYSFLFLWVITIKILSNFSCRVVVWSLCRCKTSIYGSTSQNVENL